MSADPRPNTARLATGALDTTLEYRLSVIFAALRALLGSASAAEVGQCSLLERVTALETQVAEQQKVISAMDTRLKKLEDAAKAT